eukprot:5520908-Pyramimonas_sp.AAC.1
MLPRARAGWLCKARVQHAAVRSIEILQLLVGVAEAALLIQAVQVILLQGQLGCSDVVPQREQGDLCNRGVLDILLHVAAAASTHVNELQRDSAVGPFGIARGVFIGLE